MHLSLLRCMAALMLLTVYVHGTVCYAGQQSSSLEQSICGLKEPFAFWLWSSAAGEASAARLAQVANVEDIASSSLRKNSPRTSIAGVLLRDINSPLTEMTNDKNQACLYGFHIRKTPNTARRLCVHARSLFSADRAFTVYIGTGGRANGGRNHDRSAYQ